MNKLWNAVSDLVYDSGGFVPSFHEFAHAFVSYKLGDPTAKEQEG